MYAFQPNIKVANQKGKTYTFQTIINFVNHKSKTTNKHKNRKGKRWSSVTPLLGMVELEGKGRSDINAAYSLTGCR